MKQIQKLGYIVLGLFLFFACEEVEREPVAVPGNGPVLEEPSMGANMVFTEDNASDSVFFSWEEADFGFQSATTYVLQFDRAGNDFAGPIDIATTNDVDAAFTVAALNSKLLAFGLPHSMATQMEARVMAHVNPNVDTLYSESIDLSVTPYEVVIIYPSLYVPGSYQAASGYTNDWSPADAPQLYSVLSNEKYEGYVNFAIDGAMFKFTDLPDWTVNWGDDGADGSLDAGGSDIASPGAGYYKINVNLNDMTYKIENTTWGLIGSATPGGWDADQDMSYDMVNHVWTITLDLAAGDIKFRANDAWNLDYGDNSANLTLDQGGSNIVIGEAGNYTITMNLEVPVYTYSVVKN